MFNGGTRHQLIAGCADRPSLRFQARLDVHPEIPTGPASLHQVRETLVQRRCEADHVEAVSAGELFQEPVLAAEPQSLDEDVAARARMLARDLNRGFQPAIGEPDGVAPAARPLVMAENRERPVSQRVW